MAYIFEIADVSRRSDAVLLLLLRGDRVCVPAAAGSAASDQDKLPDHGAGVRGAGDARDLPARPARQVAAPLARTGRRALLLRPPPPLPRLAAARRLQEQGGHGRQRGALHGQVHGPGSAVRGVALREQRLLRGVRAGGAGPVARVYAHPEHHPHRYLLHPGQVAGAQVRGGRRGVRRHPGRPLRAPLRGGHRPQRAGLRLVRQRRVRECALAERGSLLADGADAGRAGAAAERAEQPADHQPGRAAARLLLLRRPAQRRRLRRPPHPARLPPRRRRRPLPLRPRHLRHYRRRAQRGARGRAHGQRAGEGGGGAAGVQRDQHLGAVARLHVSRRRLPLHGLQQLAHSRGRPGPQGQRLRLLGAGRSQRRHRPALPVDHGGPAGLPRTQLRARVMILYYLKEYADEGGGSLEAGRDWLVVHGAGVLLLQPGAQAGGVELVAAGRLHDASAARPPGRAEVLDQHLRGQWLQADRAHLLRHLLALRQADLHQVLVVLPLHHLPQAQPRPPPSLSHHHCPHHRRHCRGLQAEREVEWVAQHTGGTPLHVVEEEDVGEVEREGQGTDAVLDVTQHVEPQLQQRGQRVQHHVARLREQRARGAGVAVVEEALDHLPAHQRPRQHQQRGERERPPHQPDKQADDHHVAVLGGLEHLDHGQVRLQLPPDEHVDQREGELAVDLVEGLHHEAQQEQLGRQVQHREHEQPLADPLLGQLHSQRVPTLREDERAVEEEDVGHDGEVLDLGVVLVPGDELILGVGGAVVGGVGAIYAVVEEEREPQVAVVGGVLKEVQLDVVRAFPQSPAARPRAPPQTITLPHAGRARLDVPAAGRQLADCTGCSKQQQEAPQAGHSLINNCSNKLSLVRFNIASEQSN